MTALNLFAAIFIMAATYSMGRPRIQTIAAAAVATLAPAAFALAGGIEGLVSSLAGSALALMLTMPLSLLGHISPTDVLVSIALGGALGAVPYSLVFAVATAFLLAQRLLGIEPQRNPLGAAAPSGSSDLLARDEQSALVEIEAMKILRTDRKEFEALALREGLAGSGPCAPCATAAVFPWTAKLAVATLAVLMIGTTF